MDTLVAKPPLRSAQTFGAVVFATCLLLVSGAFLDTLVSAFASSDVSTFVPALRKSAWATATLIDYMVGALFAAIWLYTRPSCATPARPLGLPHWVWGVCMPMLGNPTLYLYLAVSMLWNRDVGATLTPRRHSPFEPARPTSDMNKSETATPHTSSVVSQDMSAQAERTARAILAITGITGLFYFVFLAYAWFAEDVMMGYQFMKTQPLVIATFYDNLMGIAFCATVILSREGLGFVAAVWLFCLGILGHGVACVYAMTVAADALRKRISYGEAMATPKHLPHSIYL